MSSQSHDATNEKQKQKTTPQPQHTTISADNNNTIDYSTIQSPNATTARQPDATSHNNNTQQRPTSSNKHTPIDGRSPDLSTAIKSNNVKSKAHTTPTTYEHVHPHNPQQHTAPTFTSHTDNGQTSTISNTHKTTFSNERHARKDDKETTDTTNGSQTPTPTRNNTTAITLYNTATNTIMTTTNPWNNTTDDAIKPTTATISATTTTEITTTIAPIPTTTTEITNEYPTPIQQDMQTNETNNTHNATTELTNNTNTTTPQTPMTTNNNNNNTTHTEIEPPPTQQESTENLPKTNITWGPTPIIPRPPTHERIILQNINGLPTNPILRNDLFSKAARLQPTIIGFTETKLNCKNPESSTIPLRAQLKVTWPSNKFSIADSIDTIQETAASNHKPGGVMQIAIGPTSARIQSQPRDIEMGRWTSQVMLHANGKKSIYYTVYRVCQTSATSAAQQWRILRSSGIEEPNPRKQFLIDLKAEIQEKIARDFEIFVMGDFNTPIAEREMQDFMNDCNLFDLHEPSTTHTTAPPTFKTGRHKIDHMLGTYFFLEATISASILSWDESLPGDHRCLVIDLCQKSLQSQSNDLTIPQQRTLVSTTPARLKQYNKHLNELMTKSKIEGRLAKLMRICTERGRTSPQHEKRFENIDREMTGYMLNAEKQCGKSSKNPRHHYSPTLVTAGQEIHLIKKQRQQIEIQLPKVTRPQAAILRAQIEGLTSRLQQAWINLKQVQANSRAHRNAFLLEQAKQYAEQNNVNAAKAVEIIIRSEKQRRTFSKLRRYLKPNASEPLCRILIPNGETAWKEVTDSNEIYKLLTEQAIIEMSGPGTDQTPFTTHPLSEVIPPWTPSPYNDEILNGTFTSPHACSDEIKDMITSLAFGVTGTPPKLPITLTIEQLTSATKSKSESTASSPSGRHIGHYKAALQNERALQFHLDIINFARAFTCLPPRWSTATQVRIPKVTGMPYVNKLRMIQLLEFDMNAQFGITIGREMIWNAEDNNLFHNTPNFGNRPNKQVSSCTLLKCVSYDIMRQMHINGAVCNNDLAKCYDRVHAGIGMLACQRLGVPKKICDLKLKLLDRIRIYARSAFGLAPTPFGNTNATQTPQPHTPQVPRIPFLPENIRTAALYGILQGTQDAGAIWLSLWAVLYMILDMIIPGLLFTSPDHSRQSKRKGEAFVDDTDIWVTDTTLENNTVQTITEGMTTLFQRWYRALRTTGGMLGFDKCFWYLIKWEWRNGKPHMATITEAPAELTIATDDDRNKVTIQRLEPDKGLRTLGVRLAPTGNQNDEYQYRLTQAKQIAQLIYNAPLSRAETTIAHEQVWWPSVGFPLGVTTFTKAECNKIQAGFQAKFIAKMGYNRSMANAIRYGPQQYGGIGLRTIWTEQGLRHTLLALFHLRANDELGNTLQISISASQLEAGIQLPFLQTNWSHYGKYMTKTWITHTWEFLSEHKLQIRLPNVWTPQPQRCNDTYLMEHAGKMYPKGAATLQKIN